MTAGPPDLVRAYAARNAAGGAEGIVAVRLRQRGWMRRSPGARWAPWSGEEEIAVSAPGFRWRARWRMAPLVWIDVLDTLAGGAGRTDGRLFGLVPVVRGSGPAVDRGALMRYLAELPWAPPALLANPALRWRTLAARTVEVSAALGDDDVAVRLEFDEAGDVRAAGTPARPRDTPSGPVPTPWGGEYADYRTFGGLRIPVRAEVHWDLPEGRWVWWRGEVTEVALRPAAG